MNKDAIIKLKFGKYGVRNIQYNPQNSRYLIEIIKLNWGDIGPLLTKEYEKVLKQNDVDEWGKIEWLNDEWEIRIFDSFTKDEPLPEGRIIFSLAFIRNGKVNIPTWDVFMDDLEITHSQPSF